ncbi:hypothetical protein AVEN_212895-1, partial [Araneus ventricosus]
TCDDVPNLTLSSISSQAEELKTHDKGDV